MSAVSAWRSQSEATCSSGAATKYADGGPVGEHMSGIGAVTAGQIDRRQQHERSGADADRRKGSLLANGSGRCGSVPGAKVLSGSSVGAGVARNSRSIGSAERSARRRADLPPTGDALQPADC